MGDNPNETRQTLEMTTDVARRSTRRAVVITFAVALVVLVVTTLIVRSGKVSQLEKDVFHIINGLPNFLRPIMYVFQLAGLLFVPLLVAIGAAISRKWWLALCLVLAVPVKLFFEHEVIKKLVDRQRPGTSICHGDPTCGHFRSVPLHGESFVSGHAIITGVVATLLFGYLNRTGRIVVVAIALLNGVARRLPRGPQPARHRRWPGARCLHRLPVVVHHRTVVARCTASCPSQRGPVACAGECVTVTTTPPESEESPDTPIDITEISGPTTERSPVYVLSLVVAVFVFLVGLFLALVDKSALVGLRVRRGRVLPQASESVRTLPHRALAVRGGRSTRSSSSPRSSCCGARSDCSSRRSRARPRGSRSWGIEQVLETNHPAALDAAQKAHTWIVGSAFPDYIYVGVASALAVVVGASVGRRWRHVAWVVRRLRGRVPDRRRARTSRSTC